MEHSPATDMLAEEIQDVLVESKMLMHELNTVKQTLVKAAIGETTYQRAKDFMAARFSSGSFFEGLDEGTAQELKILDDAKCAELARDVFNLEPTNEDDVYRKTWAEAIAHRLYPDDTILTILEDQEKLEKIGNIFKRMLDEEDMQNNEYVSKYDHACWAIDDKISELYMQITGQDGIETIEVDETGFGISFYDSFFESAREDVADDTSMSLFQGMEAIAEMSKASIYISIFNGELRVDNEPAVNQAQLKEIRAFLAPIPKIIEQLEKETTA